MTFACLLHKGSPSRRATSHHPRAILPTLLLRFRHQTFMPSKAFKKVNLYSMAYHPGARQIWFGVSNSARWPSTLMSLVHNLLSCNMEITGSTPNWLTLSLASGKQAACLINGTFFTSASYIQIFDYLLRTYIVLHTKDTQVIKIEFSPSENIY